MRAVRFLIHGLIALFYALALAACVFAGTPDDAVVRIPSHGISGTVIWTGQGRSYVLTCSHGHKGRDREKPMTIDIPANQGGMQSGTRPRVIDIDYSHAVDLALVEVGYGPVEQVIPVAPGGHQIRGRCYSMGYDGMRWPLTRAWADILPARADTTRTRQAPRSGRSGGALVDPTGPYLVGVCLAYDMPRWPDPTPGNGIYTRHDTILAFLRRNRWSIPSVGQSPPSQQYQGPGRPACPT